MELSELQFGDQASGFFHLRFPSFPLEWLTELTELTEISETLVFKAFPHIPPG
jgi:hypothetical protein